MVAVVAIMGMLLFLFVPTLGATNSARLRGNARELGAHLEYARQRAVLTGKPHRVLIGLEDGWYQLEWFATDRDELPGGEAPAPLDLRGPIPMSPPAETIPSYRPVPGAEGRVAWLAEPVRFGGAEVDEGWYESGEFQVVFEGDGSSDPARIVVEIDDDPGLVLEVSPLLDAVRIVDDQS
jgi:hypothetical protein